MANLLLIFIQAAAAENDGSFFADMFNTKGGYYNFLLNIIQTGCVGLLGWLGVKLWKWFHRTGEGVVKDVRFVFSASDSIRKVQDDIKITQESLILNQRSIKESMMEFNEFKVAHVEILDRLSRLEKQLGLDPLRR